MSHISTLQVVYMPYSWSLCTLLCLEVLTVWRLWLAVFSLLPVSVPSHPHHVSLQAHYIYIMCMHVTSTAVHFICFGGSHAGASGTHSHIRTLYYFCTHHLPRCPWWILTSLYHHLWWYVFSCIVKAQGCFIWNELLFLLNLCTIRMVIKRMDH